MNKSLLFLKFRFLLLVLAFLASCNVQNKTNLSEDKYAEIQAAYQDSIENARQSSNPSADPLLYIEGQLCAWVRNIFQDSRGNLWFATNHYGVMRYDGDTLVYFSEKEGLGGGRVTGIVEDKEGNIWIGTYRGLSKYDPSTKRKTGAESFTNFSKKDGLIDNEVWSLMLDSKGIFWVGTMEGVSRFDGEVFRDFPIPFAPVTDTTSILSPYRIPAMLEDSEGNLWFATDGFGITKYDGKSFSHLTTTEGLSDNNVSDLQEDKKGNIWVGTMFGGISKYDGKSFTNYTSEGHTEGVEVGGIYEDKAGNIWFGAENNGVYRYDGKTFVNFNQKDGLNTNGILNIFEDNEGRFWFGGWGGLFRFNGKSFVSVTEKGPWTYN